MAIKRKQTNKSKSRTRNKFVGTQLPESTAPKLNIHGITMAGIAAHDQNGKFPRPQAMSQSSKLPENFNRIFMESLPVFHAAVRQQAVKLLPEIAEADLDPLLLILDRLLPNHPEHDTEGGRNTEALMKELYGAYMHALGPVETDGDEAATAFQVEVEKKLGALQFAALREVMGFVKTVQTRLGLGDDTQIEEASEFSSDLEAVSEEKIAAVMAEQRPDFAAVDVDQEDQKIEQVLDLPQDSLAQPD
jgi:hypothetical protein